MKFNFTKFSSDISEIQCCNNLLDHSSNSLSFSSCILSLFLFLLSIFLNFSTSYSNFLISSSSLTSSSSLVYCSFLASSSLVYCPLTLFSLASYSLASLSSTSLILLSASASLSCATSLIRDLTHSTKSLICCSIFTRFWLQNWKNNFMANYHKCLFWLTRKCNSPYYWPLTVRN